MPRGPELDGDLPAPERFRLSGFLLVFTAAYLLLSVFAFLATALRSESAVLDWFFQVPGALALVTLSCIETWIAWRVSRHFGPGEPLRRAWTLIGISAAFGAAGAIYAQILGSASPLNPLTGMANWSAQTALDLRSIGLVLGGPFRFGFLAAGLFFAAATYQRAGLAAKLRIADRILIAGLIVYVVLEFRDLAVAMHNGRRPDVFEILRWPVDPLLCYLTWKALLLLRAVRRTGMGWIGRSWSSAAAAVLLTLAGNIGLWFVTRGYLPWPWSSITWFIWLPAAGAFALAPVYQMEAIQRALGAEYRRRAAARSTA